MKKTVPGVLVTRPAHQSRSLIDKIKSLGANPVPFPCIEIHPVTPEVADDSLQQYSIIIFVSANAVEYGLQYLTQLLSTSMIKLYAIGKSTAASLKQTGYKNVVTSASGFNSEALLELDDFQPQNIQHQHILIVRGQGGREFLASSLTERGASVSYLEVYRRALPETNTDNLLHQWVNGYINIVTVTSNEILKNLYHMLESGGLEYLLDTCLITPGDRCTALAKELGFRNQILQAKSALDDDIIDQLEYWIKNKS